MEGGPVFGEHALLIGLLTRPLRQRISGAEIQVTWNIMFSLRVVVSLK